MKLKILSVLLGLMISLPAAANTYSISGSTTAGTLASGYSVVGVTDINGDGAADIIYQDGSGNVYAGGTFITTLSTGVYVVGAGNNNDNGHGIIVVQDTVNNVAIIDPLAGQVNGIGQMTSGYRIVGVGGESSSLQSAQGQLLIAWQNAAGDAHRWQLAAEPPYTLKADTDWGTIGSPVFAFEYLTIGYVQGYDFLGYPNLYHQRISGTSLGTTYSASAAPSGYSPVAAADFNGDNETDVLWYNSTTRDLKIGYTTSCGTGTTSPSITYASLGTIPTGFVFSGFGDVNADGTIDVVLYNSSTYEVRVWVGSKSGTDACSNPKFAPFSFNQGRP